MGNLQHCFSCKKEMTQDSKNFHAQRVPQTIMHLENSDENPSKPLARLPFKFIRRGDKVYISITDETTGETKEVDVHEYLPKFRERIAKIHFNLKEHKFFGV